MACPVNYKIEGPCGPSKWLNSASARALPSRGSLGGTHRVSDGAVCLGGLGRSLVRLRRQDDKLAVTRERLELDVEAAAVGMREGDADLRSAA